MGTNTPNHRLLFCLFREVTLKVKHYFILLNITPFLGDKELASCEIATVTSVQIAGLKMVNKIKVENSVPFLKSDKCLFSEQKQWLQVSLNSYRF